MNCFTCRSLRQSQLAHPWIGNQDRGLERSRRDKQRKWGMEIISPNQAPDDSIGADLFEYEVSTWSGSDRVTSWQTRFLLSVATRSLPLPVLTTSRQRQIKTPRRFHGGGVCFLTYYVERGLCRRQSGWHAESDEILAARKKAG